MKTAVVKGMVGGIQRFSTEDGPGIRTTFFLKGCPLRCKWCHNPELFRGEQDILLSPRRCMKCGACIQACPEKAISMTEESAKIDRDCCKLCGSCVEVCYANACRMVGDEMTVDEVIAIAKRDSSFYGTTGGGVTLSGGEVLSSGQFAIAVAESCRAETLPLAVETCGYGKYETLHELSELSDFVLYDIKTIDSDKHKELTGAGNKLILANLESLCADPALREKIIIRMPLISGLNDSEDEVLRAGEYVKGLGLKNIDLLPYHEMGVAKSRDVGLMQEQYETPSADHLKGLSDMLGKIGLVVTIMGAD